MPTAKKCPVCNGPARTPSGYELEMLDAGVQVAEQVTNQELAWVIDNLDNQFFGAHEIAARIDKLVAAAKRQGEQEVYKKLAEWED